ncbi:beta-ketoacyl synthase N-terminal-like domain-containing protein [Amycolatopsis anabasis]|uniref:beta-ketoacyl synthase N-terminal-like domain-containing protein n=1 Tax=Amycolatopsis anabasis TaxID=1840409 RepID=UPI00131CB37E|nr:beta-ketoacyl synthase N-terminal-like domain-containing protein [Amycolatopsis anabasis]
MVSPEPIAIVGMSVLLPGASGLDEYWHNLVTGVDAITEVPPDRRDPEFHDPACTADAEPAPDRTYCHRGGFLTGPVAMDAGAFGIVPNSVAGIEPDQLIALRVAAAAVEDAGGTAGFGDPRRVGVILGRGGYLSPGLMRFEQRVRTVRQVVRTLREVLPSAEGELLDRVRDSLLEPLGPLGPESTIGLVPNLAASRVANRLDFGGPAYTVDAACASSLVAVDHAVRELTAGRCDVMLAGGVHHCHDDTLWSMFTQLRALSATQAIRPLSRDADGLLIGEGTGVVVLKRLADARRDDDRIYAVIRGVGVSSDGRSASLFNPDTGGQALALRRAWAAAGLDPAAPDSIGLLEAHGTATKAGDAAELATIAEVFGPGRPAVIGSVKSMIGHTLPTAGVAGLVKAALALHHATLLPTLHCAEPNPLLARTRFDVLAEARPWAPGAGPRRAGVNAFGFGGINAHVVLEEAPSAPRRPVAVTEPERVLRLSAASPEGLRRLLDRPDSVEPAGRYRLGIVDPVPRRVEAARKIVARGESWRGRNDIWFSTEPLLAAGAKTAFVFPGLEGEFTPNCADVAGHFGLPMPEVSTESVPARASSVTAIGRLLDAAVRRLGVRPDGLAGHSVGEWSAMISAGMYSLEEHQLTDFPLPQLDFVVLGCSAAEALDRISGEPELVLSHDNAPRQTIVCGAPEAAERLAAACRRDGIVARILPFRSGFHTPMLLSFLEPFARLAENLEFQPAEVPVWSATTARPYPDEPVAVRELYLDHLVEPVRFRQLVDAMYRDGFRVFVQMGPGQLGSFITDTLGDLPHLVVSANSSRRPGLAQLRRVATALWAEGADPDFAALERRPSPSVPVRLATPPLSVGREALGLLDGASPLPEIPEGAGAEVVREFTKLLAETQDAARSVLAAATRTRATRSAVLEVSLERMPYLRDHRFFRQREGWPDETDWRPVVPATTLIDLAAREVQRAWPGSVVTAVHDAAFFRWLVAAPACRVPVRMEREGDRIAVEIGAFASMKLEIAGAHRASDSPLWTVREPEHPPPLPAAEIYRRREMFHGPRFQGLSALSGLGERHLRGEITVPAAPGALLDNAGQLLGCWLMATERERLLAFPRHIRKIAFSGPEPPPGARVGCVVRVRTPDARLLEMDAQLVHNGQLWAEISSWQDVRFDCDRRAHRVYAFPDRNLLAEPRADGWFVVADRWPGAATRDLYAGIYLNAAEREDYARRAPGEQRHWLLGRIAIKDAVRAWLSGHGVTGVYPAELTVHTDENGQVRVAGCPGRTVPDLAVSMTCRGEFGMARVTR